MIQRTPGSVSDVAVDVDPPTGPSTEAAALVQDAARRLAAPMAPAPLVARLPPGRPELHLTVGVVRPTRPGVNDLQPDPRHGRVEPEIVRTASWVPGPHEVGHVAHGEGGVPRAHQRLGRLRQPLALVQRATAPGIRQTRPARARTGATRGRLRAEGSAHEPVACTSSRQPLSGMPGARATGRPAVAGSSSPGTARR